jgi:NAD(P)H dehydrogenase (quinone)
MNAFLVNAHAEPQSFNSAILRPVQRGILRFTGWDVLAPNIVYSPVRVSNVERQAALQSWSVTLARHPQRYLLTPFQGLGL